ncbi:hypothetical protein MLD38_003935 [Melastoma candidum]|uniref:Uncharacterized protein n=1 Tax=Melastoma candidum TaxID=119954 RepID=A0ACB9S3C5_9MYRT|nr:hypothetical protein MLD38_003935 [Melastoma candidum]
MATSSDPSGNLSPLPDDLPPSPHPPAQQQPSTPPAVQIPAMALPYLPAPFLPPSSSASSNPRRLPPPCWSHEETVALIDAYCDKWYSLRRGNLKATHWQEVADAVLSRCPGAPPPPKTAVQCRHKMEKLRKRYRTELQRARSLPVSRFVSSWVHFARMDAMEKGPSAVKAERDHDDEDEEEEEDDDHESHGVSRLDHGLRNGWTERKGGGLYYGNGIGVDTHGHSSLGSKAGNVEGGFRVKIPTGVSIAQRVVSGFNRKPDRKFSTADASPGINNPSASAGTSYGGGQRVDRDKGGVGKRAERDKDVVEEMVAAIKMLGDGFVRMEQMKMEMAREIESMRMEMEMKRTEMILESQQRIVEAFAKAASDRKRKAARKMTTAET